ncbi:MAG TPA: hypothetical protein PKM60_07780 [Zoogloea sp.]|uniref:hypothetical protein n=1 Tax=Zoogloea sp. TaxID=49181 RepID=UPI002CD31446|nr:hypothetical protein [Zoogloea sp.]HOB46053.1 hypothetical protein [Zoogloea sp.]HQA11823.1 hypothetical protein [Zoogloea sp.]HQE39199.1 hypothetical protein [Zoogloea sp.]
MTDDIKQGSSSPDNLASQPHLDLGNLVQIAEWIANAAASGVVGNAAYNALKNLRSRYGKRPVDELKEKVFDELRRVKHKPGVADADLKRRVEQLFADYDKH